MNRLERIKERAGKATKGPWVHKKTNEGDYVYGIGTFIGWSNREYEVEKPIAIARGVYPEGSIPLEPEDAEFIAASRQDIENLVKVVEAATKIGTHAVRSEVPGFILVDALIAEKLSTTLQPLLKEED